MVASHLVLPVAQLAVFPRRAGGVAVVVVGLALNVWADGLFTRARTPVNPFEPTSSLVVAGPFAFSRNPMYLGMVLVLAGIAAALGSATPWLVIPMFIWEITRHFIVPEERKLEAAFGSRYLEYRVNVPRWL
jgi:protein-S-isoprenylcysteine O-methyltransferase Ste14